ncbi:hypothetical protein BKA70DRAFT_1474331 [Coprinopsis sp. MPI-PUGE-AT-0042]|nr:hypothetical protein BKA70DRAFT_1474331 [Coprinopsis sp. MPI-PUGE-AT-0042]
MTSVDTIQPDLLTVSLFPNPYHAVFKGSRSLLVSPSTIHRKSHVSSLTVLSSCFAFREERLHCLSVDYVDRRTPDDLRGLPERREPEESAMTLRKSGTFPVDYRRYKRDPGLMCASRTPQARRAKTSPWYVILISPHVAFKFLIVPPAPSEILRKKAIWREPPLP